MAARKVRIGIIGVGGAGRAHARRFLKNPRVDEVHGYDIKKVAFSEIQVLHDFDSFIDTVDAVSICTPDSCHYEYIVKCLERKKHVLVEKPMVANLHEAAALKSVLERHLTLTFAVHHQMRFVRAFAKARELLKDNALGDVFYIEANYWHDMRERNTQFDDWRVKGQGQSVIFGGACHPLDLILSLIPADVVEHSTILNKNGYAAYPSQYTSATSLLKFSNGVVAKLHANNCVVFPQFNNLIILGDRGTYIDGILYNNTSFSAVAAEPPPTSIKRLLNRSFLGKYVTRAVVRNRFFRQNPNSVYDHNLACQVIVDNFVESIIGTAVPLVGYVDGTNVIRLCEALELDGLSRMNPH